MQIHFEDLDIFNPKHNATVLRPVIRTSREVGPTRHFIFFPTVDVQFGHGKDHFNCEDEDWSRLLKTLRKSFGKKSVSGSESDYMFMTGVALEFNIVHPVIIDMGRKLGYLGLMGVFVVTEIRSENDGSYQVATQPAELILSSHRADNDKKAHETNEWRDYYARHPNFAHFNVLFKQKIRSEYRNPRPGTKIKDLTAIQNFGGWSKAYNECLKTLKA